MPLFIQFVFTGRLLSQRFNDLVPIGRSVSKFAGGSPRIYAGELGFQAERLA
jgi:hypothetical protein